MQGISWGLLTSLIEVFNGPAPITMKCPGQMFLFPLNLIQSPLKSVQRLLVISVDFASSPFQAEKGNRDMVGLAELVQAITIAFLASVNKCNFNFFLYLQGILKKLISSMLASQIIYLFVVVK